MDVVHAVVVEARVVVHVGAAAPVGPDDLHVGQPRRLGHAVRDVDAEAVDPALQPEPQRLLEVVEDLRVVPVQVRLLGVEQVQVPLAGVAVGLDDPGPRRATEDRHPVVRRMIARRRRCRRGRCSAHAGRCRGRRPAPPGTTGAPSWCGWAPGPSSPSCPPVGGGDQPRPAPHAAEQRVDVAGIRDVVAVVGHRRHHTG